MTLDSNLKAGKVGGKTDDQVVSREEEAIKLDGLNVAQLKELREKAEKHQFQAEVDRMMKLIINSLYSNKEIFLRELISNASDALDKIRVLALTDKSALDAIEELAIRIKVDKENSLLHITDTGIGMTKQELINNLGVIAKSGTSEFLEKVGSKDDVSSAQLNDLIGQFGVGFYSSFLVANRVIVTSKSNEDPNQYIWESDSGSFSINEDPRGPTLKRGSQITLHIREESKDFLDEAKLRELIQKYSQFINYPIYLWSSRTEEVEEPLEEEEEKKEEPVKKEDTEEDSKDSDDAKVEEEKEESKPKTKKVQKTVWEWQLVNTAKPLWTRKPSEIGDDEYNEFYKSITKDHQDPLAKVHFVAEGEVTFKSLLFIPKVQPSESFNRYGAKTDHIKLYVRRVFITDSFQDMMPSYLAFIRGVVDSDDLPLNVSREMLQQHKLLKVIKKKLIRKVLDMIKKIPDEDYEKFWKEYGTNIKLGTIEDTGNRNRLAKLLRFKSSALDKTKLTSLTEYVGRMKEKQDNIYYVAGANYEEVASSPFVERLLADNYEILYLTDAVDEYCLSALPEFEGKKFQNIAKDGLKIDEEKEKVETIQKRFEPLTKWLETEALKDKVSKVAISQRLHDSPCVLVASQFGWTGNMERLAISNAHSKSHDITREYYLSQKKALEINPKHPIIKEMLRRVEADKEDETAKSMAMLMYETATLRSGYMLQDTSSFAKRVETLLRKSLGVDEKSLPGDEDDFEDEPSLSSSSKADESNDESKKETEEHTEL